MITIESQCGLPLEKKFFHMIATSCFSLSRFNLQISINYPSLTLFHIRIHWPEKGWRGEVKQKIIFSFLKSIDSFNNFWSMRHQKLEYFFFLYVALKFKFIVSSIEFLWFHSKFNILKAHLLLLSLLSVIPNGWNPKVLKNHDKLSSK